MALYPQNVPATAGKAEGERKAGQVVRRVEITVERRFCSIEGVGMVTLEEGQRCPVCGAEISAAERLCTGPDGVAGSAMVEAELADSVETRGKP